VAPGRIALLQAMPIFGALRDDALECLLEGAPCVSLARGEFYFHERDIEQFALIQMNIGREVCRRLRATDELLFQVRMGAPWAVDAGPTPA
jgi:CRP/FNR family transcriptional regulator, cyclic AMP receptor protein